jgi:hypothetical protein
MATAKGAHHGGAQPIGRNSPGVSHVLSTETCSVFTSGNLAAKRWQINVNVNMNAFSVTRLHLKEDSDFRNERDVVPTGIRTGPNPQNFCFLFF